MRLLKEGESLSEKLKDMAAWLGDKQDRQLIQTYAGSVDEDGFGCVGAHIACYLTPDSEASHSKWDNVDGEELLGELLGVNDAFVPQILNALTDIKTEDPFGFDLWGVSVEEAFMQLAEAVESGKFRDYCEQANCFIRV